MSKNNGGNASKANIWKAKLNCTFIVKNKKLNLDSNGCSNPLWITTLSN